MPRLNFLINRPTMQTVFFIVTTAMALTLSYGSCHAFADGPDFLREVRPILSKACFHCHGPDEETREAELRLDQPDGLFVAKDGHITIERGHADRSEMVRRILSTDPDEQMPPASSGKSLTDAQKKIVVDWVNSGAAWPEHWAFKPPQRPKLPRLERMRTSWIKNEIDHFVVSRFQTAGLDPSPSAPVETLVRRVFLDLIGLPPTLEEANSWVTRLQEASDKSGPDGINDDAYRKLVEHLLSRPEYGERWARHWLDLARYADTNGYEKDRPRSIWPYRDWVIQALNDDMPFDQFTIEQIAGDMLPNATSSQTIATGFHRNTMLNEEGGIDPLEFRFHAMTDRVATTGTTWLGLTTGCAQCHTHKYDPLTHREYYQLMAFLNNADEPSLALPDDTIRQREEANRKEAERLLAELPSHWPVPTVDLIATKILQVSSTGGEQLSIVNADGSGSDIDVTGAVPDKSIYTVDIAPDSEAHAGLLRQIDGPLEFQLHAIATENAAGPGRSGNGNFVLSEIEASLISSPSTLTTTPASPVTDVTEVPVKIASVKASVQQKGYAAKSAIDGDINTGWAVDSGRGIARDVSASFRITPAALREALPKLPNDTSPALRIRLVQQHGSSHVLGRFDLSFVRDPDAADQEARRQASLEEAFQSWLAGRRQSVAEWTVLTPAKATSNMPFLAIQPDGSVLASGDTTKQDRYEVVLNPSDQPITAIRLEALPDERLPGSGPGTTYYEGSLGDFYLNELNILQNDTPIKVRSATDSYRRNKFGNSPVSASLTIDGDVQTGWSVANAEGQRHTAVYILDTPIPAGSTTKITMTFGRHFASSLGKFRFCATHAANSPVASELSDEEELLLTLSDEQLAASQRATLRRAFMLSSPELAVHAEKIRNLLKPADRTTTLVMSERPAENPRPTFRHHRGEYLQPKEAVSPGTPEFLQAWNAELPKNRLGFAKWLVDRSNPLTARVIVNRHWAALFGRGIVSTVDDFGIQGTAPTHPELLDWLAVTFMDDDRWSIKSLHRRIVLSATYRQHSVASERARTIDPVNELLSHSNRFRLDAEMVRDSIVQAAGVLSKKQGGPPVRPIQPPGITEVAFGSPGWDVSGDDDRYRRSIYTFIKRTAPFAMVTTFDGPTGEACLAERNRSNTPLQALTLLNDPMFIDLAQATGRQLASQKEMTDQDRIQTLFVSLLTREPQRGESAMLVEFVGRQRKQFSADIAGAKKLMEPVQPTADDKTTVEQATWTAFARALFSLDEVVMRP
jgi:hypothetical protein